MIRWCWVDFVGCWYCVLVLDLLLCCVVGLIGCGDVGYLTITGCDTCLVTVVVFCGLFAWFS